MAWFFAATGHRIWYEDLGSGPPLIFIHGWCMSSCVWEFQVDELSSIFRVICIDLHGHGRSETPSNGFSIRGCAEDITALIARLELVGAVVVGWSLGATVAVDTFLADSRGIAGLVLVSATPRFTRSDDFPYGLSEMEAAGMATKVRRDIHRALAGFIPRMFAPGEQDATAIDRILSLVPEPDSVVALQALNDLVGADLRNKLPTIDCPVLIIYGDKDRICLPQASEYLLAHISCSESIQFPGCGHAPFLTQSGQFNDSLKNFQGRVSGVSSHQN